MNFFRSLINPNDSTISVRSFAGLCFTFTAIVMALSNVFFKFSVQEFIFYGILTSALAAFGLTTITTNKKIDALAAPTVTVEKTSQVNVDNSKVSVDGKEVSNKQTSELAPNEIIG